MVDPCLCVDVQSLPFAVGNPGSKSGGRDDVVSGGVHPAFQFDVYTAGTSISGSILSYSGTNGSPAWRAGVFSADQHLYPSKEE